MKKIIACFVLSGLALLAGCGKLSKQELTKKAENVKTKDDLEKLLGKPDHFEKMGPVEQWTYNASDGEVVFTVGFDKVVLSNTTTPKK